ncbi:MAG: NUDIX hydrolase [Cryobacterium sp.]|nr:NUDIX hydrolase [Cryobacterium sp.]MBX3090716.1 NUDIX hydrolase [Cryobacterium sp.]MCO5294106.1 NUDIX hydrolase [Homoserinimonas sp.]MCW5944573.1 NUDIX hydrolase [Cryobacterium sp.]
MPELPDLRDIEDPAQVLDSQVVFKGAIWDVRRDRFRFGDGELVREYLDHSGSVMILAIDADDRVVLLSQYRHPAKSRMWELPAGLRDVQGEPALETARRELAEEADLQADDWEELISFFTSVGGSTEFINIYRASGLRDATEVFIREGEEAQMEVHRVPFAELLAACLDGSLSDGPTVTAVLAEHARRTGRGDGR